MLSYLQDTDLSVDLKALQDDLQSKFGDGVFPYEDDLAQDISNVKSGSSACTENSRRRVSVVYQEEKFATGRYLQLY